MLSYICVNETWLLRRARAAVFCNDLTKGMESPGFAPGYLRGASAALYYNKLRPRVGNLA